MTAFARRQLLKSLVYLDHTLINMQIRTETPLEWTEQKKREFLEMCEEANRLEARAEPWEGGERAKD